MGADCYFEGKWDVSSKTYILHFSVDNNEYYMFRHNKLFKLFDGEKRLLFSVISRHELSERLSTITGFAVKLPPRERNSDDGYVQELEKMCIRDRDYGKAITYSASHATYYPGAHNMTVKTLYDPATGRILGAQIVGFDGVDKRMDVLATAIRAGLTAADLTELDLALSLIHIS